ncbi:MAG: hypothetical protein ACK53Y_00615, partial [bacterium]
MTHYVLGIHNCPAPPQTTCSGGRPSAPTAMWERATGRFESPAATAACTFQRAYWKKNENDLEAHVFNNDFFLCERPRPRAATPGPIKWTYLRRETREEYLKEIMSLKMKNIIVDGNILDYDRFCAGTGIPFTANEYMYISTGARYARERYGGKP